MNIEKMLFGIFITVVINISSNMMYICILMNRLNDTEDLIIKRLDKIRDVINEYLQ